MRVRMYLILYVQCSVFYDVNADPCGYHMMEEGCTDGWQWERVEVYVCEC